MTDDPSLFPSETYGNRRIRHFVTVQRKYGKYGKYIAYLGIKVFLAGALTCGGLNDWLPVTIQIRVVKRKGRMLTVILLFSVYMYL